MNPSKSAPAKERPAYLSSLAAQLLGHSRVGTGAFTARQLTLAFPAFGGEDLANAIDELLHARLVTQAGQQTRANYTLTDRGRSGAISVS